MKEKFIISLFAQTFAEQSSPINSSGGGNIESEYDTASDSGAEHSEQDEYEEDEEDNTDGSLDEEEDLTDEHDDGILDDERISGDGQEEQENGEGKKKVDDDEDRSNPQYIPKKGTFYEHDDRTAEDLDAAEPPETIETASNSTESKEPRDNKVLQLQNHQKAQPVKPIKKPKDTADRWTHDRFNENEQAPKSRAELVSAYGYDIRNEDNAPRPRRQRRYG